MTGSADSPTPHTDEELAILERAAEQQEDCPSIVDSEDASEHARLFTMMDELAAPIRSALARGDLPPQIPDYDELLEIGRGGMGVVYRGRHRATRRIDAVKIIRPDRLMITSPDLHADLRHRFERESQLASRVAHESIVPVFQVGEAEGRPWYSMQLVDGASLAQLCDGQPLPPTQAALYIERIARALDVVHHHGILHGDIKPHNILIERDSDRPLLTDFGLGDLIAACSSTENNMAAGTIRYMAPELLQTVGSETHDIASGVRSVATDVYSLGVTLWTALTGEAPAVAHELADPITSGRAELQRRTERLRSRDIPDELIRICMKCQALEPENRYRSAKEFADALRVWIERPAWNQYFPGLRTLLWSVLAPFLAGNGFVVWWLRHVDAPEPWIWLTVLGCYAPLFLVIFASQQSHPDSNRARRAIWSQWFGHALGAIASFVAVRTVCPPDQALSLFYPCWAAISATTFMAKSGNFWSTYRWIGFAWACLAPMLAITPNLSPLLFGLSAAFTCVVIAFCDRSLADPTSAAVS